MKKTIWCYFWKLVDIELKNGDCKTGYIFSEDSLFNHNAVFFIHPIDRKKYLNAESLGKKRIMRSLTEKINVNDIVSVTGEVDKAIMAVTSNVIQNTPIPKSLQKTFKRGKNKYGFYRVINIQDLHKYTDILPDDFILNPKESYFIPSRGISKFDM